MQVKYDVQARQREVIGKLLINQITTPETLTEKASR